MGLKPYINDTFLLLKNMQESKNILLLKLSKHSGVQYGVYPLKSPYEEQQYILFACHGHP
jgi:hypothetical protein